MLCLDSLAKVPALPDLLARFRGGKKRSEEKGGRGRKGRGRRWGRRRKGGKGRGGRPTAISKSRRFWAMSYLCCCVLFCLVACLCVCLSVRMLRQIIYCVIAFPVAPVSRFAADATWPTTTYSIPMTPKLCRWLQFYLFALLPYLLRRVMFIESFSLLLWEAEDLRVCDEVSRANAN